MVRTEVLSDFQCCTIIGCHLSNKSVYEVSTLLELPRSTVSIVIVKWKRLGATTAQPRSGRPHKLTERGLSSAEGGTNRLSSVATLTTEFKNCLWAQRQHKKLFVGSFMKWLSVAEQPRTSLRSPCAMPSVVWSAVKLAAIGLWSSGNACSGVMNHASPSGRPKDKSGIGGC